MNRVSLGIIIPMIIALVTGGVFIGKLEGRVSSLEEKVSSLENIDFKDELKKTKDEINALSLLPSGTLIALWRNQNIPAGWVVCGQGVTPDLNGRFLLGTRNHNEIGNPVGEAMHTHPVTITTGYEVEGAFVTQEGADNHAGPNWNHKHLAEGETTPSAHLPPSVKVLFLCRT